MDNFGKNIKRLRTDCHLTQEELGKKAGLSGQVISNLERGVTSTVDPQTMNKLAKALQVPVDTLTGGSKLNTEDMVSFSYENGLPEKLKQLMEERKVDCEMVAIETGIPESKLEAYVYSRKQPIAEDLIRLSEYFRRSMEYLLGMPDQENIQLSQDEKMLIYRYRNMSQDCREYLQSKAHVLYVEGIAGVAGPGQLRYDGKKSYQLTSTEESEKTAI